MAEEHRKFGNREMQKRYDESRPKAEKEGKGSKDGEEHEEKPIEDVVSEHGPADHVEIHSHHGDGHVHKSSHHSAMEAHDHVSKAFDEEGGGMGEGEHHEPDGDEGEMSEGMGGGAMPTMR
jgi:hypothetical protein